jgi:hypothetical protein
VPAFKQPEWKNARTTLMWMGAILGVMFTGISILAAHLRIVPDPDEKVTVLAQMGRAIFGSHGFGTVLFAMLQIATMLILVLAANTSFADFPRLASFIAADRFLPRQLTRYGDRLVFSNGILVLSGFATLLVIVFKGSVTALIPLFASRHGRAPPQGARARLARRRSYQRHRFVRERRRRDHHREGEIHRRSVGHLDRHPADPQRSVHHPQALRARFQDAARSEAQTAARYSSADGDHRCGTSWA